MSESGLLPWLVIRQDDDGSRYRVGRYATRLEAQTLADRLRERRRDLMDEGDRCYLVERLGHSNGGDA
ncbi:SPOR domain-containing protein [Streptomyces sp. 549]|uniref:SPOR domain-containing protein n=1 Tax=Streptomyces sp. 549 TaxID=3049076 RepID=UPI0024C2C126|nr:SPOR domain-containing protein [Streptomyces sp. 549]MDK1476734.1 SPOR domain-containing protein [Streptomyces sp. 549]